MKIIDYINNAFEFTGIFKIPFYRSSEQSYTKLYRSVSFFPLMGLLTGSTVFLIDKISITGWEKSLILLLLYVIFTRATHIDGFVDCADAFFGAFTKERRLEILKDSRIGVFGGSALVLLMLSKLFLYRRIIESGNLFIIPVSMAMARHLFVYTAIRARYPREKGTAKIFVENIGITELVFSGILVSISMFYLNILNWNIFAIYTILFISAIILRIYASKKLGGITGDVLGAVIEITEIISGILLLIIKP
jgi:adenosylcobinamide-GDP ribazoletransferase